METTMKRILIALLLLLGACGGGSTPPPDCTVPSDCPGPDTECGHPICVDGSCQVMLTPAGTPLTPQAQTAGDCRALSCDGAGGTSDAADDSDVPADDGDPCTDDVCVAGAPDRKSTRLNSSHIQKSRMPSSA